MRKSRRGACDCGTVTGGRWRPDAHNYGGATNGGSGNPASVLGFMTYSYGHGTSTWNGLVKPDTETDPRWFARRMVIFKVQ